MPFLWQSSGRTYRQQGQVFQTDVPRVQGRRARKKQAASKAQRQPLSLRKASCCALASPSFAPTTPPRQIRGEEPDRNSNQDWPTNQRHPVRPRAHVGKMQGGDQHSDPKQIIDKLNCFGHVCRAPPVPLYVWLSSDRHKIETTIGIATSASIQKSLLFITGHSPAFVLCFALRKAASHCWLV